MNDILCNLFQVNLSLATSNGFVINVSFDLIFEARRAGSLKTLGQSPIFPSKSALRFGSQHGLAAAAKNMTLVMNPLLSHDRQQGPFLHAVKVKVVLDFRQVRPFLINMDDVIKFFELQ